MDEAILARIDKLEKWLQDALLNESERSRDRLRDLQWLLDSRLESIESTITKLSDQAERQPLEAIDELSTAIADLREALDEFHSRIG